VSRYLMPLSFAAILGGTVTVVGTSTSLVVSGLLQQQGRDPLGLLEQTPVGLPVAIAGMAVLLGIGAHLLPERGDPAMQAVTALREFAVHLEVRPTGPLVGRSVSQAGLRSLSGVFLADLVRGERHIGPVSPDEVLEGGDLLIFVGDVSDVIDLRSRSCRSPTRRRGRPCRAAGPRTTRRRPRGPSPDRCGTPSPGPRPRAAARPWTASLPHLGADGRNRRSRSDDSSTETLDSDIAALASTGDSRQPVSGASTPAAIGRLP
jgi:hypothetical protein